MRQLAACRRLSQRNVLACGLTTEPGSGRTRTGLFSPDSATDVMVARLFAENPI